MYYKFLSQEGIDYSLNINVSNPERWKNILNFNNIHD